MKLRAYEGFIWGGWRFFLDLSEVVGQRHLLYNPALLRSTRVNAETYRKLRMVADEAWAPRGVRARLLKRSKLFRKNQIHHDRKRTKVVLELLKG
jgi:hypothetical protein